MVKWTEQIKLLESIINHCAEIKENIIHLQVTEYDRKEMNDYMDGFISGFKRDIEGIRYIHQEQIKEELKEHE